MTVVIPKGSTGERAYYANFRYSGRESINLQPENQEDNKIWAANDELFVRTSNPGNILRIYSVEGVLLKQQTIIHAGETKIKLSDGLYVVTLNHGVGQIVSINSH
jgi:hypothetical protein